MTTISPPTSTSSVARLRAALTRLSQAGLTQALVEDPAYLWDCRTLDDEFQTLAHAHQDVPGVAQNGAPWHTWLVLGGRGAGKTRLGAEWVRATACGIGPLADCRQPRIALVGDTEHDVRAVMIEGDSGILRISPRSQRPTWTVSRRRLEWPNGAVAEVFSAEDPDSLRGPQFHAAWCDEAAKWRQPEKTMHTLRLALRLGERPRVVVTTTPRPIPLILGLMKDENTAVTRAGTAANAAYLSPVFMREIVARYRGTRLGRQEIDGEILEDRVDALWSRAMIEEARVAKAPELEHIVIGVDPPASPRGTCGIVAAGRAADGCVYVLEDASVHGLSPAGWAEKAVALFYRREANSVVAEVNQGGDMVTAMLHQVEPYLPIKTVHAMRGKYRRAEPVAALYEQEKAKHVDPPPTELEDQMCDFGPQGLLGGGSPDRVDALVWAVTELTQNPFRPPRIYQL